MACATRIRAKNASCRVEGDNPSGKNIPYTMIDLLLIGVSSFLLWHTWNSV